MDDDKTSKGSSKMMETLNRLKTSLQNKRVEVVKDKLAGNRGKLMLHKYGMSKLLFSHLNRDNESTFSVKELYRADPSVDSDDPLAPSISCTYAGTSGTKESRVIETILPRPHKELLPPRYTTWVFTDRNRLMIEGQSIEHQKRIYYNRYRKETVILSDSEDELQSYDHKGTNLDSKFTTNEDFIIWKATQTCGVSDALLKIISSRTDREREELKDRYNLIMANDIYLSFLSQLIRGSELVTVTANDARVDSDISNGGKQNPYKQAYLELTAKFHRISFQDEVFSDRTPCEAMGKNRFLLDPDGSSQISWEDKQESHNDGKDSGVYEQLVAEMNRLNFENHPLLKRKTVEDEPERQPCLPENLTDTMSSFDKLFCRICLVFDCELHGYGQPLILPSNAQRLEPYIHQEVTKPCGQHCNFLPRNIVVKEVKDMGTASHIGAEGISKIQDDVQKGEAAIIVKTTSRMSHVTSETWNNLEVDLFNKGLQIFGKSSCLIAQNLLQGYKNCAEVGNRIVMRETEVASILQDASSAHVVKARMQKKRGSRKIRFTQLSHKFSRKIAGENLRHQYYPCSCSSGCGDQCTCKQRRTSCEKYCGCSSLCKNRFPGCQCGKSQCSNKLCPCFSASRECDPDVCRNCSLKRCGDIVHVGDNSANPRRKLQTHDHCLNMRILLNQKKSVLLGRSDISGWGLFLKDAASTHDYLGEYTGELISQLEADKRGKLYDIVNLSFLFDLNDKFVIDGYRLGSKLKFANHSRKPNCYPRIVKVAGQHRVGIFAKRKIEPGEELFFDYQYEKELGERAPLWAKNSKEKKST